MNKRALLEAIRTSDLPLKDKVLLRMAVAFHKDKVEEAVNAATSMQEAGVVADAVEGSPDWPALIKFFIDNVLPILLQLLKK